MGIAGLHVTLMLWSSARTLLRNETVFPDSCDGKLAMTCEARSAARKECLRAAAELRVVWSTGKAMLTNAMYASVRKVLITHLGEQWEARRVR